MNSYWKTLTNSILNKNGRKIWNFPIRYSMKNFWKIDLYWFFYNCSYKKLFLSIFYQLFLWKSICIYFSNNYSYKFLFLLIFNRFSVNKNRFVFIFQTIVPIKSYLYPFLSIFYQLFLWKLIWIDLLNNSSYKKPFYWFLSIVYPYFWSTFSMKIDLNSFWSIFYKLLL